MLYRFPSEFIFIFVFCERSIRHGDMFDIAQYINSIESLGTEEIGTRRRTTFVLHLKFLYKHLI